MGIFITSSRDMKADYYIECMIAMNPNSPKERIVELTGLSDITVKRYLSSMVKSGRLTCANVGYTIENKVYYKKHYYVNRNYVEEIMKRNGLSNEKEFIARPTDDYRVINGRDVLEYTAATSTYMLNGEKLEKQKDTLRWIRGRASIQHCGKEVYRIPMPTDEEQEVINKILESAKKREQEKIEKIRQQYE